MLRASRSRAPRRPRALADAVRAARRARPRFQSSAESTVAGANGKKRIRRGRTQAGPRAGRQLPPPLFERMHLPRSVYASVQRRALCATGHAKRRALGAVHAKASLHGYVHRIRNTRTPRAHHVERRERQRVTSRAEKREWGMRRARALKGWSEEESVDGSSQAGAPDEPLRDSRRALPVS